ncbi:hypothetical protein QBC35DRAFT_68914 [Podospora australis]|uniref:FAD-binding domain-containing protein n=1 Tax=Podospora australis TaxID=1536484 RepID=A0AAN7AEB9_9PEZI|nr:hypothetical protein QBC35DRAFT_68914 [Podospora australis]
MVSLLTTALQILDQLGILEKWEQTCSNIRYSQSRDVNGELLVEDWSYNLIRARHGYPPLQGERRVLLELLYENLQDKSRTLAGKEIIDVLQDAQGVTAVCKDGSRYRGDVLVGCDGVRSTVKRKMWDLAEKEFPDAVNSDKNALFADHCAVFGIAYGIEQMRPGEYIELSHDLGRGGSASGDKGSKVFYFVEAALPERVRGDKIPRYEPEDLETFINKNADMVLRPGPNGLTMGDLFANSKNIKLVPIEQGKFNLWHYGRIVCAGDSVHKSTPSLGSGGNGAIESVAMLTNGFKRLHDECVSVGRGPHPSQAELNRLFEAYRKEREGPSSTIKTISGYISDARCLKSPLQRLFIGHVQRNVPNPAANAVLSVAIGGVSLEFLPLPQRSLNVIAPFNPTMGFAKWESILRRTLAALPLLALAILAACTVGDRPSLFPLVEESAYLRHGNITMTWNSSVLPTMQSFINFRSDGIDSPLARGNLFLTDSMYSLASVSPTQMVSFMTDFAVLYLIWLLESGRRANNFSILKFPALFAAAMHFLGAAKTIPFYCFLHYVFSSIDNFVAGDLRLTKRRWTSASLPALCLAYLTPFYLAHFWPGSLITRQYWMCAWQLFPISVALSLWGLSRCFPDTEDKDKVMNLRGDLPVIRCYVCFLSAVAAWAWISRGWADATTWGFGLFRTFLASGTAPATASFSENLLRFWQWEGVYSLTCQFMWLGYLFWDLRRAGMLQEGWWTVMSAVAVGFFVAGPGTTTGVAWLGREYVLAYRSHKDAMTREKVMTTELKTC